MEQIIYIALDSELHTELHRENIAHEHATEDKTPTNSNDSWKRACLIVRLQYSEPVALSLYEISSHHTFDLTRNFHIPIAGSVTHGAKISNGHLDGGRTEAREERISVTKLAEQRARATKTWSFDIDDLISKIRDDMQAAEAAIEAEIEACEKDRIAKIEELRIEIAAIEKKEAKKKAIKDTEIAAQKAAKKAWIEANGSERLKLGVARGHNCEKLYTLELCDSLPENFDLDYEGEVKVKDRSCPSLEALKLCEELEKTKLPLVSTISIVWLPHGLDDLLEDEDRYEKEPSDGIEAIEIKINDHYAYHLIPSV